MADYSTIPSTAKVQPKPFKVEIDANDVSSMKHLLAHSKIGPATYENQQTDRRFGMNRDWLINAKKHWETEYDWYRLSHQQPKFHLLTRPSNAGRRCEKSINSFPNFTIPVTDDKGSDFTIHFLALFSRKSDAIPLIFLHGWPGSILEFLSMLAVIKKQYPNPEDLPYHIIVPSLPGYAFSSSPPIDRDFKADDMAPVMNALMVALGFGSGYIAQGGDLGSFIARQLGVENEECKAFHLNLYQLPAPSNASSLPISQTEKNGLDRAKAFTETGSAYAREHGTRTATIGLVLSSSPLALLTWIGEKFLEWTDADPTLDEILDSVSLYWLTDTYARCIYPYRTEISPTPVSWVKETGNFVHTASHEEGGHFAAMEKPEVLWGDVEEFVKAAWNPSSSSRARQSSKI
ncbi:unnamed protein product [Aureobasidium pullulans]|nr:unnamed protein product [Aureobasidium pullulans]